MCYTVGKAWYDMQNGSQEAGNMDRGVLARAGEIVARNTAKGAPEGAEPYCLLRFKTERYNLLADWKEAGDI